MIKLGMLASLFRVALTLAATAIGVSWAFSWVGTAYLSLVCLLMGVTLLVRSRTGGVTVGSQEYLPAILATLYIIFYHSVYFEIPGVFGWSGIAIMTLLLFAGAAFESKIARDSGKTPIYPFTEWVLMVLVAAAWFMFTYTAPDDASLAERFSFVHYALVTVSFVMTCRYYAISVLSTSAP